MPLISIRSCIHRTNIHRITLLVALVALLPCFALGGEKSTPLALKAVRAFPELRLEQPVAFTHAGDGSDRIFVVEQKGVIRVFANHPEVKETKVFLDIEKQVFYKAELGLLGLAFHPDFKKNGQLFVYYTIEGKPYTSVISRFRLSSGNANRVDVSSEEVLMEIEQPYENHNGGTLAFGPDGYLYIGLGDGGLRDDPHGNGQNLKTLLGSILRIDVDHQDAGKNYAVPKDNPFVGKKDARDEIWAYGLRNVWRLSFDRKTGQLWAADVGQNIWEEINLIERGGNYGWKLREGKHKFGEDGSDPREDLIEPIWEYHHDEGKSITGGNVYRGNKLPELRGVYLFADYVTNRAWALKHTPPSNTISEIQGIDSMPIITFGEDEAGEVYFTDSFGRMYTLERVKK